MFITIIHSLHIYYYIHVCMHSKLMHSYTHCKMKAPACIHVCRAQYWRLKFLHKWRCVKISHYDFSGRASEFSNVSCEKGKKPYLLLCISHYEFAAMSLSLSSCALACLFIYKLAHWVFECPDEPRRSSLYRSILGCLAWANFLSTFSSFRVVGKYVVLNQSWYFFDVYTHVQRLRLYCVKETINRMTFIIYAFQA